MKELPHNYYDLAPTIMPVEEVYKYLDELLALIESEDYSPFKVCEALDELIVTRLTDNYAALSSEYSARVFKWLSTHWPSEDLEHLDLYLTLIVNLADRMAVREYLEKKIAIEKSEVRRNLIVDALSEV